VDQQEQESKVRKHWIEGVQFNTQVWHAVIDGAAYTLCGALASSSSVRERREWKEYMDCWPACTHCLRGMELRAAALLRACNEIHRLEVPHGA
jgi:hypothetical protein